MKELQMASINGKRALTKVLAQPSVMNAMSNDDIIAAANEAVNTPVEKFFSEQITSASVDAGKSALAQLALLNRKNAKAA
jgi:DNA-binding protein YbaB